MKNLGRRGVLAAGVALAASPPARAQAGYPDRPVKLVVGFPAGGATDVVGRLLGQRLSELLGKQFVVENKPGAAGNIGADAVAKADGDGHTLILMDVGNLAATPSLFPDLTFDVKKDLAPETIADSFQYLIDEFLELLYRRDVIPMETPEKFDRKVQKAIKTVETTDPSVENTIHQILKRGFLRAGRLLRAEEVVVNRLPGTTSSNS